MEQFSCWSLLIILAIVRCKHFNFITILEKNHVTTLNFFSQIDHYTSRRTRGFDLSTDHAHRFSYVDHYRLGLMAIIQILLVFGNRELVSSDINGGIINRMFYSKQVINCFRDKRIRLFVGANVATNKNALTVECFWINFEVFSQYLPNL